MEKNGRGYDQQPKQVNSSKKAQRTKESTSKNPPPTRLCTLSASKLNKYSDHEKLLYVYPKLRKMNSDMDELKRMAYYLKKFMDENYGVKIQQKDEPTSITGLNEDLESPSCFGRGRDKLASKENLKTTKSKTSFKGIFGIKGKPSPQIRESKEKLENKRNLDFNQ